MKPLRPQENEVYWGCIEYNKSWTGNTYVTMSWTSSWEAKIIACILPSDSNLPLHSLSQILPTYKVPRISPNLTTAGLYPIPTDHLFFFITPELLSPSPHTQNYVCHLCSLKFWNWMQCSEVYLYKCRSWMQSFCDLAQQSRFMKN